MQLGQVCEEPMTKAPIEATENEELEAWWYSKGAGRGKGQPKGAARDSPASKRGGGKSGPGHERNSDGGKQRDPVKPKPALSAGTAKE